MKILHTVQRYSPDIGGSEEVVRQLSEHLVALGHDVTVATGTSPRRAFKELNGVQICEFSVTGNSVDGMQGETEAYLEFLRQSDADVMMNYAAQIWSTDLVFRALGDLPMKKVLVPCGYSRLRDPRFDAYFRSLPEVLRQYDRVVYLSDHYIDAQFGREHGLTNGIMIPNGADPGEFPPELRGTFRKQYGVGDRTLVLNVSNHSLLKGHDFFWNCLRGLDTAGIFAVLIGNAYRTWPGKWLSQCYAFCRFNGLRYGVPVLEHSPRKRIAEAYTDADIFLFGSRVECSPLVMFEAFASRTLFVTTDCGNVGDYRDIACIVPTEHDAIEVIREYHAHPDRYRDRIEQGYRYVLRELNWSAIARQYEALYRHLVHIQ